MKKLWILILILIIGAIGFIYFSPIFERVPPKIIVYSDGYTNLKNSIKIEIKDNYGIKSYKVILIAGNVVKVLQSVEEPNMGKDVIINLKLPKNINSKEIKLIITAKDTSKWHFLAGNETKKEVILKIDKTAPDAQVVNNSYAIGRGGSAVAIVKVSDNNLKDAYIIVNGKYKFKLTPFKKEGYYISLIAWPYNEKEFSAELIAEDLAGNKVSTHIPYFWRTKGIYKFKNKNINITDKFIDQVGKRVLQKMNIDIPNNPIDIFKAVNEKVRKMNEIEIYTLTSNTDENLISKFNIRRFKPLPSSAKMADFGDIRHYIYHKEEISRAIHKGVDLAKIKRAKIYASNNGIVIANKYIGIYGNALIIYHGLGLYSLYGHTSEFLVKKGEKVYKGKVIARTGATGAVFGDHLHFGIYIQGIPVQPLEWMDSRWIKTNITNIINSAKKAID